ncbi:OmpA family protein [Stutzerimonas tarimensis]|uniref:OmpA family protein n=1 Tax=Stutzerimonas tarimensis TaxID=1507735 RepID=A0ABV7TBH5_9GAMM
MKLFKSATLILCISLAACSSKETAEPVASVIETPKVEAAWLDKYETHLRSALKDSRFEVSRNDAQVIVTAPVDSSFNPDRPSMLLPAVLGPITKVAKLVENDHEAAVMLLGHGDVDDAVNRTLSRDRAGAFGAIFRMSGLKHDRLMIKGLGADAPRADNASEQGRAQNRRIEMVLLPQRALATLASSFEKPIETGEQLAAVSEAGK